MYVEMISKVPHLFMDILMMVLVCKVQWIGQTQAATQISSPAFLNISKEHRQQKSTEVILQRPDGLQLSSTSDESGHSKDTEHSVQASLTSRLKLPVHNSSIIHKEQERQRRKAKNESEELLSKDGCQLCQNGGESYKEEGTCFCICKERWQGPTCEHNKTEVGSGVILTIKGETLHQVWYYVWETLVTELADIINTYCYIYIEMCCPIDETMDLKNYRFLPFLNPSQIRLGNGYPVVKDDESNISELLVYVTYSPVNELCASTVSSDREPETTESKYNTTSNSSLYLDVSKDSILPQDTLWFIIKKNKMDLRHAVWDCCRLQLTTLTIANVTEGHISMKMPMWGLVVACSVTVSVVVCGVLLHYVILKAHDFTEDLLGDSRLV